MTDYEPGTVAVATVLGEENVRVIRGDGCWVRATDTDDFFTDDVNASQEYVIDVRPLVVLDLNAAPEQVSAWSQVAQILRSGLSKTSQWLADEIEAQSKPLKPAEPTGLGAVVEDEDGTILVRTSTDPESSRPWVASGSGSIWHYDSIDVVRVLSEGVQA